MPNPKRRHSKRRTSARRTHDSLTRAVVSECPNCHEPKLQYRVCPACGWYNGRQAVEMKTAGGPAAGEESA